MKNALLIFTVLLPKYVFVANAPAPGNSATSHEVLATTVTAVLKQTADFNTSNKLLKVSLCADSRGQHWVQKGTPAGHVAACTEIFHLMIPSWLFFFTWTQSSWKFSELG